ncbi:MAG: Crp/Fnr family transcriptional regulator [Elusimicrobiota bacterium]|jgi:CRP-like cAMP-binding protein
MEDLEELTRRAVLRRYRRREAVFEEGDPPRAVFLLRSGLLKALKYTPRTEPCALEVIVPGALFGMIAVLDEKPYPVSALAIQDSEAYTVPAAFFEDLLARHPRFAREVFRQVGEHLRNAQGMRALAKESAERRIARVLVLLGALLGREVKVRREDVAEMAGTTPETAVRVLADFRRRGLVSSGWKRIVVAKPDRLLKI